MKKLTLVMKRVFYSILLIVGLVFASCDNEVIDGIGTELTWENTTYSTQRLDKTDFFVVPQEGDTYTFVCTNRSLSPEFAQVSVRYPGGNGAVERCVEIEKDLKVEGNKVTVSIPANVTTTRYIYVNFIILNDHGERCFVQEGIK